MSKSLLAKVEAALTVANESLETVQDAAKRNVEAARKITQATADLAAIRELRTEFERIAADAKRPVWLTSTQMAAELSVHEETVRRWYHEGRIRGHRIAEGGFIRFDPHEVAEDVASYE